MLKINNLTKTYLGSNKSVKDLTLHVESGDLYAFIGHNGAGKTTTLKAVCGIHDFESGEIFINGINIKEDSIPKQYKTFAKLSICLILLIASFLLYKNNNRKRLVNL